MRSLDNVRAVVKALEDRASKDRRLSKALDEIERALKNADLNEDEDEDGGHSRARLPYSSEPPVFEMEWN